MVMPKPSPNITLVKSSCPECPSVYYMLIGADIDGGELYKCHKCKCEWKWLNGKRSVTKQGTLNEEIG